MNLKLNLRDLKKELGQMKFFWDTAEDSLKLALNANDIDYSENPGDGAFYGPKIDFSLKDSLSRVWQLEQSN